MQTVPYTYFIGWSALNIWYVVVRFAKGCDPSDLWVKYFTSSKYVKDFRARHGEPDKIIIDGTFNNMSDALAREESLLKRLFSRQDLPILNKSICGNWDRSDAKIRERQSLALKNKRKTPQHVENLRKTLFGNSRRKGTTTSEQGIHNMSIARLGLKPTDETRRKMSVTRSGKKFNIVVCPHCQKSGGESAMKQWHFNHCKYK